MWPQHHSGWEPFPHVIPALFQLTCERQKTKNIQYFLKKISSSRMIYVHWQTLATHRDSLPDRERGERVRAGEQVSKSMWARHINVRWECEWSCSCETAACCKAPGPLQTYFLSACVWTQRGIMGAGRGKDADMFPWMDKNSFEER